MCWKLKRNPTFDSLLTGDILPARAIEKGKYNRDDKQENQRIGRVQLSSYFVI